LDVPHRLCAVMQIGAIHIPQTIHSPVAAAYESISTTSLLAVTVILRCARWRKSDYKSVRCHPERNLSCSVHIPPQLGTTESSHGDSAQNTFCCAELTPWTLEMFVGACCGERGERGDDRLWLWLQYEEKFGRVAWMLCPIGRLGVFERARRAPIRCLQ